jgi:hypothetical protein
LFCPELFCPEKSLAYLTMTDPDRDAASVIDLLTRYSFDLSGYTADRLAEYWLQRYPSDWIRLAVVEALYQGRYKVISVEQILNLWGRRGKPLYHFNPDFERIITPRFVRGRSVQAELVVLPPEELPEINLEAPEPAPIVAPIESPKPARPVGAIQPFSVSGSPLPGEAIIRGFYAQVLEVERDENLEDEPEAAILPTEVPADDPVFFPEAPNVEFKSIADGELPIQPFQPEGEEFLGSPIDAAPKDLVGSPPIHQFVPTPPPSEFYAKLKAIVQNATKKT